MFATSDTCYVRTLNSSVTSLLEVPDCRTHFFFILFVIVYYVYLFIFLIHYFYKLILRVAVWGET